MGKEMSLEQLMDILRKSVIGQEQYLKKIAVTVWLHNNRIRVKKQSACQEKLQKHNLLCVGPTGSGKTLAVSILADLCGLDVMITDMSAYTGSGWKGREVKDMIVDLWAACGHDRKRAEKAIVILDEIDKMVLQNDDHEYASFGAENAMLKIIEGMTVQVSDHVYIDTTDILFIGAGAFEGIEWDVKKRVNAGKFGFHVEREDYVTGDDLLLQITRQDVLAYGMGAQLMGRFADIAVLRKLDINDFKRILMESEKSVVKSIDRTLQLSCGVFVAIDESGAEAVAKQAIREDTGARGLAQIIMPVINDTMFLVDQDETVSGILITAAEDGEPAIKLIEGARCTQEKPLKTKQPYDFPHMKRKNVEHFCWHLLSGYLEERPEPYSKAHAMHSLLCSIVFYVGNECDPCDQTLTSIQKLVEKSIRVDLYTSSIYEVLLCHVSHVPDIMDYYRAFEQKDPDHETIPVLKKALGIFQDHPCFPERRRAI